MTNLGVPESATSVSVFLYLNTGNPGKVGEGIVEIYSLPTLKRYAYFKTDSTSAWRYNSDNYWLPINTDRTVIGLFYGLTDPNLSYSGSVNLYMQITGYCI